MANVSSDLERGDSIWLVREWLLERSTVDTWGVDGWNEWARIWAIFEELGCSVFPVPADMTVVRPARLELTSPTGERVEEELRAEQNPILSALRRLATRLESMNEPATVPHPRRAAS